MKLLAAVLVLTIGHTSAVAAQPRPKTVLDSLRDSPASTARWDGKAMIHDVMQATMLDDGQGHWIVQASPDYSSESYKTEIGRSTARRRGLRSRP